MAIERERMLDIAGLEQRIGGLSGLGGLNFLGGGLPPVNIPAINIPAIQGPVLGPDDFGSYTIPFSDPTYRSGFDYARSIAGGIPMEQVIAPGVSYSPEQPGGYTQEQLNIPRDVERLTPPPILPPTREFDDPRYFGTGIGGVNIPVDRKQIPFRNIFGGVQIPDVPPISGLQDIGKLFDFDFDREAIEKIVQERIAENMPTEDIPSSIPEVPTGRDFSVDRERIPPQDFGYGPGVLPPLPPMDIRDIPPMDIIDIPPKINDQIFIDDRPIIDERIVDRGYGPGIMPPLPPMDIDKLIPPVDIPPVDIPPVDIPPVDIPPVDIPFIPFIKPPSIMDRPLIMDTPTIMDRPTGGSFSISQPRPMGLF